MNSDQGPLQQQMTLECVGQDCCPISAHVFSLSSRKVHRGGTVRDGLSIKGHDDVDRMGEADTSTCFLSRGSSRLLRYLPF